MSLLKSWTFWKFILILGVVVLLIANLALDLDKPFNVTTKPTSQYQPKDEAASKAAAFTFIAALAALVSTLPKGSIRLATPRNIVRKLATPRGSARLISIVARLTGLAGAVLAGWFALYAATGTNPRPYLDELLLLSIFFIIIVFVLGGLSIFNLYVYGSILVLLIPRTWSATKTVRLGMVAKGKWIVNMVRRLRPNSPRG